jgi:hypothetical protein
MIIAGEIIYQELEALKSWEFRADDVSVQSLIEKYITLLEYPNIQDLLEPYYNARFTPVWRQNLFDIRYTLMTVDELISTMLTEIKRHRERKEEITRWLKRNRTLPEESEELFMECTLKGFEEFLTKYEEGALVTLVLLETVDNPEQWRFRKGWASTKQPYNMQYVPGIIKREPIDVLQLLEKINDEMTKRNYALECAKYYWHGEHMPKNRRQDEVFEYLRECGYGRAGKKPNSLTSSLESLLAKFGGYDQYMRRLTEHIKRKHESVKSREGKELFLRRLKKSPTLESLENQLAGNPRFRELWGLCHYNEYIVSYLQRRACDIFEFGQEYADVSFPQPTIKGAVVSQVAEIVDWMVAVLEEPQRQKEKKETEKRVKEAKEEIERNIISVPMVPVLYNPPPRVLEAGEIETIRTACLSHLAEQQGALEVIKDLVQFCSLLSKPENHILVSTGQYVDKQVNVMSSLEMRNTMVRELTGLESFTAYIKVSESKETGQRVIKEKIRTLKLPPVLPEGVVLERDAIIARRALEYCKPRAQIEQEIRQRQEGWRTVVADRPSPGTSDRGGEGKKEGPPPRRSSHHPPA